jgi:hypothetical protein
MMNYELIPTNGQKSFYGKAVVKVDSAARVHTLYSYNTAVARIDGDGADAVFTRLWDGYSVTTMKHVNQFRDCNGMKRLSKAEWNALPVEPRKPCHSDMTPAESYRAMIARRVAG